jgi:quercetin dioxygenase-like cupin family protein
MPLYAWKTLEIEKMNDLMGRQAIHAENVTVARLVLKAGAKVPLHYHVNEQVSMVTEGLLRFVFPTEEIMVGAGEVMVIPPHVPHSVDAVEDSIAVDLFAPRREDWISGNDAYLRGR